MPKRLGCSTLGLLLVLVVLPAAARAQTEIRAVLGPPQTTGFPRLQAYLDVRDAGGAFVHNLKAEQGSAVEDERLLPLAALEEVRPGAQVVIAISPGASFAIRNNRAVSRYDLLKQALRSWGVARLGSNLDDWSLLITDGPAASHTPDSSAWLEILEKAEDNSRTAKPSLDTLYRAVALASDPTPRPGMGRAVLFVAALPEGTAPQNLDSLAAQAQEQGVRISVWLVASSGALTTQPAQELQKLTQATGGQFFAYAGEEILPDPEALVEPLRNIYRVEYDSAIAASGAHTLAVQFDLPEALIESNTQSFEIDLQPPQPAFVAPPLQIDRQLAPDLPADQPIRPEDYSPQETSLQVIFDFPDGRLRPLVHSVLLVDGTAVAENREPPFETFTWPLGSYTTDSLHQLQVQATDSLGLTGASVEIPVQVSVEKPAPDPWRALRRNIPALAALAALVAGAVVLLVLILGGRLRPRTLRAASRRRSDPVTQPVLIDEEPPLGRFSGLVNRLQWTQRHAAPTAQAFLICIPGGDEETPLPPIPIAAAETILGSDPNLATVYLNDPAVEPVHARLTQESDGSFHLADEGSVAGTWVNFTPITRRGITLENGDLIHMGRSSFRFTLRQPGSGRKPVVQVEPAPPEQSSAPEISASPEMPPGSEQTEELEP